MFARQITRLASSSSSRTRITQLTAQLKPHYCYLIHNGKRTMASLPTTMKGIQIEKTGGVEVLEYKTDLPVPVLKEGEVLVKNEFIGINYIDIYFRTGLYPAPKPEILGREAEGTIVATASSGELYSLKVGDRVGWLGTGGHGAYAEYTAVPALKTVSVPSSIAPGIAAASLLQGLTALTLIQESHHVKKGDYVLVHAAAGGVGLWLMQLLRTVGAHTIGTSSTQAKLDLARANGAEHVINYKDEDVVQRVKEITAGQGVAVVYDSTGKDQFENDLEVVARKGSVISYGNSSGHVPPFQVARLAAKNIRLMRPTLFNYLVTREEFTSWTATLFALIADEHVSVSIHETYPLQDVAKAHADLEGRRTTGKLLLKI